MPKMPMNLNEKIERDLEHVTEGENLRGLAQECLNEGITLGELYEAFDKFRDFYQKQESDIKYNAVLDTMDYISGHCSRKDELVLPETSFVPGTKVRLKSTGETGIVIYTWHCEELQSTDCHVAFYGEEFPKGEPAEKPYVLRYTTISLQPIADNI